MKEQNMCCKHGGLGLTYILYERCKRLAENSNKKKVLIVTHWFYPRQNPRAFRAFELYKKLREKYNVDVIIGDYKYHLKHNEDFCVLDKFDNSTIINKNARLSNLGIIQICQQIVQYFVGERFLLTTGPYIYNKVDIELYDSVISIGLPFYSHLIVSLKLNKLVNRNKIVAISDWGDPFVGDSKRKLAPYFDKIQKYVCNYFDYVVTPTETAVSYYEKYTDNRKIKVIPQGFDFNEVKVKVHKKFEVPHFAYAGIFYSDKRNPEKFLQFLASITDDFVFTIYTIKHGPMYQDVIAKYEKILGDKLVVCDMVPRLECIEFLSENDFLINIDNISSIQIPSKLIDYGLAKRPVLSFKQDKIPKQKFMNFLKGKYEGAQIINLEPYNIENVCNRFIELIERDQINGTLV